MDEDHGDGSQNEDRNDRRCLAPGGAAERTEQPEGDVAELAVVGDEDDQADAGIGNGGDGEAGEQEDGDRRAAAARGAPAVRLGGVFT
jgi:hypothetical protein